MGGYMGTAATVLRGESLVMGGCEDGRDPSRRHEQDWKRETGTARYVCRNGPMHPRWLSVYPDWADLCL